MRALERLAQRLLRAADAAATRLYGWRLNPLFQTGAIAVVLLAVLIATGLYLTLFYRVGSPWASVARLQADPWLGRWLRSVHRFASDALVVAVAVHAWRMFAQARAWGARALAWSSGVILLAVLLASGWTGYVMVWDTFGAHLAASGARMFDALPVLSEPMRRIFAGDQPIPGAFFFLNLFLHVALPLGAAAGLWIHLSRLARPTLAPPRALLVTIVGALVAISVLAPVPLAPEANMLAVAPRVAVDLFYAFWLPWADALPPWLAWTGAASTLGLALMIPMVTRRPRTGAHAPSVVDERHCTGCNQCPVDCPWEAITMIPRTDGRATLVANVDAARCVSCGICAGSCAPMGVGPAQRTGRDQMAALRLTLGATTGGFSGRVVAICCEHAAPSQLGPLRAAGADVQLVGCAGNLHSSVIELSLRGGAAGVMVYSCAPRDCRGREGPKWLHERLFNDREAELQSRVDRQRVATAVMAVGDAAGTLSAWRTFTSRLGAAPATSAANMEESLDVLCDPQPNASLEQSRWIW